MFRSLELPLLIAVLPVVLLEPQTPCQVSPIDLVDLVERGNLISRRQHARLSPVHRKDHQNQMTRYQRSEPPDSKSSSYSASNYGPVYGHGNYVCLTSSTGIFSFFAFTLLAFNVAVSIMANINISLNSTIYANGGGSNNNNNNNNNNNSNNGNGTLSCNSTNSGNNNCNNNGRKFTRLPGRRPSRRLGDGVAAQQGAHALHANDRRWRMPMPSADDQYNSPWS